MSKLRVVSAVTTSAAPNPGRSAMERRKFTTARCGSPTPFGRPVEPEV